MATNHRDMTVSPAAVWAALADGYTYGHWVVGTRKIRDVDAGFPAKGTSIHYTVGYPPLRHDGHTDVVTVDEGRSLELEIHASPAAVVRVVLEVRGEDRGGAQVVMTEHPVRGPLAALHNPLFDAAIKLRNVEALRRLEQVAQRKDSGVTPRQP